MLLKVLRFAGYGLGLVLCLLLLTCIYEAEISGPNLRLSRSNGGVHVDAKFGEYNLGLDRLVLTDLTDHCNVLEVMDLDSSFDLASSTLDPLKTFGTHVRLLTPKNGTVTLVKEHKYQLKVWGNNGYGNIRPSSCQFCF